MDQYALSIIAIAGTLLGATIAGTFGLIQSKQLRQGQEKIHERQSTLETSRWAHALVEERQRMLWTERRALYTRVIESAQAWIDAIRDLGNVKLPDAQVSTREDVKQASPVAWTALSCQANYRNVAAELRILAHPEISEQARVLWLALIDANRAALNGAPDTTNAQDMMDWLICQMRARLAREGPPLPPKGMGRRDPESAHEDASDQSSQ